MPYKDKQNQRDAWNAYYSRNKAKVKKRVMKRKALLRKRVQALKNKPCADCKNSFPPVVMDFDHIKGEKVMDVSMMIMQSSWDDVIKEIEKCEVVCANCHRLRTAQRLIK